ncbi:unnamed protein product [Protopolystoma xenopodis]|uniref:C2H2-type domain-containing protein n=1 Tax=Protopolystoma xenopodis TaxID=117903 RepID=A0A448WUN3_9PLAT|nr:unnamed protein product [Protopolystoma xenopodis]
MIVKPYGCPECGRCFSQRCSLEGHRRKIHKVVLQFAPNQRREVVRVCERCGFACAHLASMLGHVEQQHPDEVASIDRLRRQLTRLSEKRRRLAPNSDARHACLTDMLAGRSRCQGPASTPAPVLALAPAPKTSASGFVGVANPTEPATPTGRSREEVTGSRALSETCRPHNIADGLEEYEFDGTDELVVDEDDDDRDEESGEEYAEGFAQEMGCTS